MRWLGGTTPEGRADLPAMLAPEGAAWVASEGVPSWRWWPRQRSDAYPAMAPERVPGDSVPTTMAAGCVPCDHVRGPSRRWPVQARDAFPAIARGFPIRTRWQSGRSNHGAESCADRQSDGSLVPAQRVAHQPRRTSRSGLRSR
jgi:hypothetical protein